VTVDLVQRLTEVAAEALASSARPDVPVGDRHPGRPHDVSEHDGHDVANLTTRQVDNGAVGRRVCLTCDLVLGPLALCNQPTKKGRPCRVPVRTDLGHTVCWSHGEGRGRTNTPRQKRGAA